MHIDEFEDLYEQYSFEKGLFALSSPKTQFELRTNKKMPVLIFVQESSSKIVNVAVSSDGIVSVPHFIQDRFR
ncbi:hypothetical protein PP935_gp176 [Rhizobium phage RHph_N34]|uniref:Uncharacterized protein n=1 Tax=Rhizobium phage RHph_N34 TaxID=2509586 RepID=A0A7S5REB6_9CAUD|nr:hypothetical protein PP935_gp176 [Rhizobium phage RHph_N34]QIG73951.1 hypothetical protein EVC06_176 [Rhizobium phage RHph_N34]